MQILNLTPYENTLIGKYKKTETVAVLCDTSAGPFTLQLPDLTMAVDTRFIIKNIGSNLLTVKTVTGQYMDNIESITIVQWNAIELVSDKNLRYIIINKYV